MEGYFIAAIVVLQPASRPRYFEGLELTPRNCPSASSKNVDTTCRPRTGIGLVLNNVYGKGEVRRLEASYLRLALDRDGFGATD